MRIITLVFITLFIFASCSMIGDQFPSTPTLGGIDLGDAVSVGGDLAKAASLTDEEVRELAVAAAVQLDSDHKVAKSGSSYDTRLKKIVTGFNSYDGLKLNYKVYVDPQVNAFALADGSIRVYSGLMDLMSDEEVLSVIGHEIGHVKLGHRKKRMQRAYMASGAVTAAGSAAGSAAGGGLQGVGAEIGTEVIAELASGVLTAQFSQGDETVSDEYGASMLVAKGRDPQASVKALKKLGADSKGEESDTLTQFLSSHPQSDERIAHLEEYIVALNVEGTPKKVVATAEVVAPQKVESTEVSDTEKATVTAMNVIKPSKPQTGVGTWYLQVGAYIEVAEANAMKGAFASRGEPVSTRPAVVKGIRYHRVILGPYVSLSDAAKDIDRVYGLGITKEKPIYRNLGKAEG